VSVLKRLTVLREEAEKEALPQRRFFHIGPPETLEDLGECVPMIAWVSDNLSRFIVSDTPSSAWSRTSPRPHIFPLPNRAVQAEDGIFVVTTGGHDHAVPHPGGKGSIHFVHLGATERLWDRPHAKLYVYRLDGVQVKTLPEKKG
jgi:hypothetical protein